MFSDNNLGHFCQNQHMSEIYGVTFCCEIGYKVAQEVVSVPFDRLNETEYAGSHQYDIRIAFSPAKFQ